MKKIGETSGGSVLVELNKSDWEFLCRLGEVADQCTERTKLPPKPLSCGAAAKGADRGKGAKERACVMCGKTVKGGPLKKCCSDECLKEYRKKLYREGKGKKTEPAPAPTPPAPAGKRFCQDCGVAVEPPRLVCTECAAVRIKKQQGG